MSAGALLRNVLNAAAERAGLALHIPAPAPHNVLDTTLASHVRVEIEMAMDEEAATLAAGYDVDPLVAEMQSRLIAGVGAAAAAGADDGDDGVEAWLLLLLRRLLSAFAGGQSHVYCVCRAACLLSKLTGQKSQGSAYICCCLGTDLRPAAAVLTPFLALQP